MDPNSPGSHHSQWLRRQFSSQESRSSGEPWPDLLVDRAGLAGVEGKRKLDVSAVERNNIVNIW